MKKVLDVSAGVSLILSSGQVLANEEIKVGQKIYDRAFGRGCGSCHDIATNPQLIKSGELDKAKFSKVLKKGKNTMPAAMAAIMAVGPVKKAGFSESQAIDAVYKYLSK